MRKLTLRLISLISLVAFLFSFSFVHLDLVKAQKGGGGGITKPFTVGTLFQPSKNGNDAHLNSNPVQSPDGSISLVERSNFEISSTLRSSYLSKMLKSGRILTQEQGRKFKLPQKLLNVTSDQVLPVGIVRNLAVDGIPAGATINQVSFVGVFLQVPDFQGGEEPAQYIKNLSLFYYDGSSVVRKTQIAITSRVVGREMLSSQQFNDRFGLPSSILIKEYKYPGMTVTRMSYPSFEDAPGFVPSDPSAERFNYYTYLFDITVSSINVPAGRVVGFGITAEEVCQTPPCSGKFFLTIGKNFDLQEDQDAYIIYFLGNYPLFFETSYGPITLYDSTGIYWPAYTRANIQFSGTMRSS